MNYFQKISELFRGIIDLSSKLKLTIYIVVFALSASLLGLFAYLPSNDFPLGQIVTIYSGDTLQGVALNLKESNVIRSPFMFRLAVSFLGGEKKLIAGDYLLDKKEGPLDLAYRITQGKFHTLNFKATIPEGWNSLQIAEYLKRNLKNFDSQKFIELAKDKEGYLFPDTYFLSPTVKPEVVVETMTNNFKNQIKKVLDLEKSEHTVDEIIIMASILEEEARTTESRRMVAGILWKRLEMGMPLQVDSTFLYINGKTTYELTAEDLKINSPYNTYKFKGLPAGPISNPGLDAISSAINPIESKYLYFLSSKSGNMYYATTFEQHKRNKELYLNK